MKSGIYRSPNGNLIYVGSDRTVRAASLSPSSWPGKRVTMREKDSECYIEGLSYRFERVGDVPYGFSFNPQQALEKFRAENAAKIEELFGPGDPDSPYIVMAQKMQRDEDPIDTLTSLREGRAVCKHPALGIGYGRDNLLTPAGYKRCHAQSAKKHRRQGHEVVSLGYGVYAWRESSHAAG